MDYSRAPTAIVFLALLSACGGPGGSAGTILAPQSAGAVAHSASGGSDILYVNNAIYSNTVTVYGGRNRNLLRTITNGLDEPDSLALDRSGHLYVSNDGFRDYNVNDIACYRTVIDRIRLIFASHAGALPVP